MRGGNGAHLPDPCRFRHAFPRRRHGRGHHPHACRDRPTIGRGSFCHHRHPRVRRRFPGRRPLLVCGYCRSRGGVLGSPPLETANPARRGHR
ncbi:hypothetical protein [Ornithinimicrobium kibberense]|uniref:hypothetical protein n=1 Tax=Ornithinimicrobium kibberense TaxID=282060 RepID=UPI00361A428A